MSDAAHTMRRAKDLLGRLMRQGGRCPECGQESPTHADDCKAHATYHELAVTIGLYERGRAQPPTPALLATVREALAYQAEQFDGPPDRDLSVSGADLVDWFSEWRRRAQEAYSNALRFKSAQLGALLELRHYAGFDEEADLTREQFDAMLARADQAIGGKVELMGDEEFNALLNGPLSHPLAPFVITRLSLALAAVVSTSPAAAEALRAHCRAREEDDRRKGGDEH